MNFKNIHIGEIIKKRVAESGIEMSRICNFLKCDEISVNEMFKSKDVSTDILLRWSKILEYDFFRIYTQHLILYAPPAAEQANSVINSRVPHFRKNIYTREIIDFILEEIFSGQKTKNEIIQHYNIPKTTLYKWISKYKSSEKR